MFDCIDLLEIGRETCRIEAGIDCTVYVKKSFFDVDLLRGFATPEEGFKQLSKDAPRSEFIFNGLRYTFPPQIMPLSLMPYCTQAVMGLPVEILHQNLGLVRETGTPLHIRAYTFATPLVHASKDLLVKCENVWKVVNVAVLVVSDTVIIHYKFYNETREIIL